MNLLAFDTSGPWCAAALMLNGQIADIRTEEMARGQAERLMVLLEEILRDADIDWPALDAIGVGTGPGNFTGIRIAVSAARGLAMALRIPAIGVNGFDARSACHPPGTLVAVPAPHDRIYVADPDPRLVAAADLPAAVVDTALPDLVQAIAHVAESRAGVPGPAPAPQYVRPADAAPARDLPPVILDP